MIELRGPEFLQLEEALASAFPGRNDLERMVRFELDENLEQIAGAEFYSDERPSRHRAARAAV